MVLSYWVDKSNFELEILEVAVVFFTLVMVTVMAVVKADGVISNFNESSLLVEVKDGMFVDIDDDMEDNSLVVVVVVVEVVKVVVDFNKLSK